MRVSVLCLSFLAQEQRAGNAAQKHRAGPQRKIALVAGLGQVDIIRNLLAGINRRERIGKNNLCALACQDIAARVKDVLFSDPPSHSTQHSDFMSVIRKQKKRRLRIKLKKQTGNYT